MGLTVSRPPGNRDLFWIVPPSVQARRRRRRRRQRRAAAIQGQRERNCSIGSETTLVCHTPFPRPFSDPPRYNHPREIPAAPPRYAVPFPLHALTTPDLTNIPRMPPPTAAALAQLDAWILEDIQRRNLNLLNNTPNPFPAKVKPINLAPPGADTETEEAALKLALLLSRQEHEERERARRAQAAAVAEQRVLEGMFREVRDREKWERERERTQDWEKARAREKVRKIVVEERAREKAMIVLEAEKAREKARIVMEEERAREKVREIMEEEAEEKIRREKMEEVKRVLERAVREERIRGLEEERERERRKAAGIIAREALEARAQEERLRRRVRGGKDGRADGVWLGQGVAPMGTGVEGMRACVGEHAGREAYEETGFAPHRTWHCDPSQFADGLRTRDKEFETDTRDAWRWDLDLDSDITVWPAKGRDGRRWRETRERRETVVRWDDEGRDECRRFKEVNKGERRFA